MVVFALAVPGIGVTGGLSVAGALLSGCGGGQAASPEGALASFAAALRAGRYDDAYGLMSQAYRRRVTPEAFRRQLEDSPGEALETAEALAAIDGPAEQLAFVPYGEGETLELSREGGHWRIVTNVANYYDQTTPRAALRSFVRAMERQRYDVVLALVPNADREGMSAERMREAFTGEAREEVERLLANLRASLDSPIEQIGDRATMPYAERFTAQLLREDGVWKVEDPD